MMHARRNQFASRRWFDLQAALSRRSQLQVLRDRAKSMSIPDLCTGLLGRSEYTLIYIFYRLIQGITQC